MKKIELKLRPEEAFDEEVFHQLAQKKVGKGAAYRIVKRSVDARQNQVWVRVHLERFPNEAAKPPLISYRKDYPNVASQKEVIIVGAGPAGLFAALRLIEHNIKPIVIERGKDVKARRRDLAAINKDHVVNPDSNYCFGEGGAGTYSDGKLYTRSKKRGDVQRILEIFVAHGAREEILYDAHPHIGTNKLPKIVTELRESILAAGGEVHFDSKVTDFVVENGELKGVEVNNESTIKGDAVILATGHSARDIFALLDSKGITIEEKPFALGVRIEHPQNLIDRIQYHCETDRGPYLPASSYALVNQVEAENGKNRGVFSFCMCPGGFIVPAATAPGELVVNGMSPSRRDSKFANSGMVVSVELDDLKAYNKYGRLAAMQFQKEVEQKACNITGGGQTAPAQRMVDFVEGKVSSSLNDTSYQPGLSSLDMTEVLPDFIAKSLRKSFKAFGKKMKGYYTNEAQIIGVESRTSSPVRIPRNKETLEHVSLSRLYPCGEGAGYAGGIVSAAMDGERCAEAVLMKYLNKQIL
ncbi:FAD-binding protein [Fulvivirga maritima]|uniref:NAD(P)/FAD-dependent oxidoreductase n=1 Tax=Fulvivirga maritima TaxID=2904247 RepID=UPI001F217EE3|nr:FAD-binding protein [Fulvivirga maritima]UII24871.1 FAD-binding protein [Fulvivirga maritima]